MMLQNWGSSLRNPDSSSGTKPWGVAEQNNMLTQAMKYNAAFDGVFYHTNSVEFANYYSNMFNNAGITKIKFVITPAIK